MTKFDVVVREKTPYERNVHCSNSRQLGVICIHLSVCHHNLRSSFSRSRCGGKLHNCADNIWVHNCFLNIFAYDVPRCLSRSVGVPCHRPGHRPGHWSELYETRVAFSLWLFRACCFCAIGWNWTSSCVASYEKCAVSGRSVFVPWWRHQSIQHLRVQCITSVSFSIVTSVSYVINFKTRRFFGGSCYNLVIDAEINYTTSKL